MFAYIRTVKTFIALNREDDKLDKEQSEIDLIRYLQQNNGEVQFAMDHAQRVLNAHRDVVTAKYETLFAL